MWHLTFGIGHTSTAMGTGTGTGTGKGTGTQLGYILAAQAKAHGHTTHVPDHNQLVTPTNQGHHPTEGSITCKQSGICTVPTY